MNFLFAWRYFKSKKSTNVINIIAWISVVAIVVGTASLIVVLSVFNGFEGLIKSMYSDFYTDLKIMPSTGKFMNISPKQFDAIQKNGFINNYSTIIEEKAVLVNGEAQPIVFLKGVDSNYHTITGINKHLAFDSKFQLGTVDSPAIVIGGGVENALQSFSNMPDPLTIYLPNRNAASFTNLQSAMNSYNIVQTGSFRIQEEFDSKYGFTNIEFVRYMLDLPDNQYSAIEIKLKPNADPGKAKASLQQTLGNSYTIQTRYEQNQSLFNIMQMEKWIIYIILSLILVIAAFNMIGALTMLVLEKRKDIAVLKALGGTNKLIQNIFLSEGFLLAIIGGALGMLLALIICTIQIVFKPIKLSGGSFLVDYYPVELNISDFLLVGLTVFVVAIVASWVPAKKAATQFFSLKS